MQSVNIYLGNKDYKVEVTQLIDWKLEIKVEKSYVDEYETYFNADFIYYLADLKIIKFITSFDHTRIQEIEEFYKSFRDGKDKHIGFDKNDYELSSTIIIHNGQYHHDIHMSELKIQLSQESKKQFILEFGKFIKKLKI